MPAQAGQAVGCGKSQNVVNELDNRKGKPEPFQRLPEYFPVNHDEHLVKDIQRVAVLADMPEPRRLKPAVQVAFR